jgi:hypothetical protein
MNDTSPEIERMVHELMSSRSGAERMRMAAHMFDAARSMVLASFPHGLSDIEVKYQLCERFYHGEVDADAFSRALRLQQSSLLLSSNRKNQLFNE